VKGSAISANNLTSLARSSINSSMQLHPNQENRTPTPDLGRVNGARQLTCVCLARNGQWLAMPIGVGSPRRFIGGRKRAIGTRALNERWSLDFVSDRVLPRPDEARVAPPFRFRFLESKARWDIPPPSGSAFSTTNGRRRDARSPCNVLRSTRAHLNGTSIASVVVLSH
jgi:hypothetical protein